MTTQATTSDSENAAVTSKRSIHFVVKMSKYCNLRCTYCYEFAFLDDRRRMSLDQIAAMFRTIADHASDSGIDQVGFTWHGGEPFLVPVQVYEEIGALQKKLLPNVKVRNNVQTNMTILTDRHLDFLKNAGFFDSVGISFDVSGDQRVDKKGRVTTQTVLAHMQQLIDAGIPFGTICVLARGTVGDARNVYQFFDDLQADCRFLPFYRSTNGTGDDSETLSQEEIVGALAGIFDTWIQSENAISVRPLADLVDIAINVILDKPRRIYDKAAHEWVYVVNPNGDLWGISEIEDNRYLYGNVFQSPLASILSSEARSVTFADARQRIDRICGPCPYLGHCSGYFIADATDGVLDTIEREGCHIRGLLEHIIGRFNETGLAEGIRRRTLDADAADDPAVGPGGAPVMT